MLQRGQYEVVSTSICGSEKGEEWYRAGKKKTKVFNTWKDFIACAQYLVDNNYTAKERLAGLYKCRRYHDRKS
ncbi:MAG: prolyl oligopeptidase family serine peptidase [Ignavibacteria bacterium]